MALLCIQLNYVMVSGQFSFCLVCGLLEKKKKRIGKKKFMGNLGVPGGNNFYMGMQNRLKLEI